MLATEVASRKLKSPADWESIAGNLSQAFSFDDKQVDLTGRACRERLERLINKFKLRRGQEISEKVGFV